jgi:hypothetical protein
MTAPVVRWLVTHVRAGSSLQVACCDMIPPFPDFPTEWRATVEANIINQGYTYVQRETYSEAHVRLSATAGCRCTSGAFRYLVPDVPRHHLVLSAS